MSLLKTTTGNNSGTRKLAVFIPAYTDPSTLVTTPAKWLYSVAFA